MKHLFADPCFKVFLLTVIRFCIEIICANDTCKNGGSCSQEGVNGGFKCTCEHGYRGITCDERFGQNVEMEIVLTSGVSSRIPEMLGGDDETPKLCYIIQSGERIYGYVRTILKNSGTKVRHFGLNVEISGRMECYYELGGYDEFVTLTKNISESGVLTESTMFYFMLESIPKPYESYSGVQIRLRYLLRAVLIQRFSNLVKEVEIVVHKTSPEPKVNRPIQLEVGIPSCVGIRFDFDKSSYHLKDVVLGSVYFKPVHVKIKRMDFVIIRRESVDTGSCSYDHSEVIGTYEIMDGSPVRGESIPVRVFLSGVSLTPTMANVNNKFSVRYFFKLVVVDEDCRRFFKENEVILRRKPS